MSINIERAAEALQSSLLNLPITDPAGNASTYGELMTEIQKSRMKETYIKVITSIID